MRDGKKARTDPKGFARERRLKRTAPTPPTQCLRYIAWTTMSFPVVRSEVFANMLIEVQLRCRPRAGGRRRRLSANVTITQVPWGSHLSMTRTVSLV